MSVHRSLPTYVESTQLLIVYLETTYNFWVNLVDPADGGLDWPAWIQALGSVVGIGLAIWIPIHTRNLQQRDEAERALRAIERALQQMVDLTKTAAQAYKKSPVIVGDMININSRAAALVNLAGSLSAAPLTPGAIVMVSLIETIAKMMAHVTRDGALNVGPVVAQVMADNFALLLGQPLAVEMKPTLVKQGRYWLAHVPGDEEPETIRYGQS